MKTLILCVDRDDDLGHKAGVATPAVGRRRTLDAAIALGLADPEDSDTNALLAAVRLHDQELKVAGTSGDQVEVAAIAGHPSLGLRADRKLAAELEEVLRAARPDGIILVSDGAEDEQIMPILHSHSKVVHVHRSVVKQAPRLEGFYYVITRILDDEKQAKRFVLPFALILLVWGIAYLLSLQQYAWGATLAIFGLWLLVHAMKWQDRVGRLAADMNEGIRAGKLSLYANVLMVAILLAGGVLAWTEMLEPVPNGAVVAQPLLRNAAVFLQAFIPYLAVGVIVHAAGGLFDAWMREGRAGIGHWTTIFATIAFGLIGQVAVDAAVYYLEGQRLATLVTFPRIVQLLAGLLVAACVLLLHRYLRSFSRPRPGPAGPR
jgi:putative membrane protein